MNCVECQTDPLTPGHYCPCCGRKLSLQELRAMGASPVPEPSAAREPSPAVVEAPGDPALVVVLKAAVPHGPTEAALPPPIADMNAVRTETAKAVADLTAKAHLARAANPAPVTRRPIVVPAPPPRRNRTPMTIAAAAVIVSAIGAAEGARRLGYEWPLGAATSQGQPAQPVPAVESAIAAEHQATPLGTPVAAKGVTEQGASARTPVRAATRPKAKVPNSSGQQAEALPVVAPVRAPEMPRSVPTKVPVVGVAEPPRMQEPPTGRFFERSDVDEAPQIVARVAPRLPAGLAARASNAIVVVRVLVSRSGHPFHVSLLRGSSLGRAADDAVIAAVTQWTFSPATKRGEPVNCWYNMGVPLSQAD